MPASYIVEPHSGGHTHNLILLHGLGSNGEKFGKELLDTAVSSRDEKLPDILPSAKFIFPTAKRRRSSAFGWATLIQWFDIALLDDPLHRKHIQIQGLIELFDVIVGFVKAEC